MPAELRYSRALVVMGSVMSFAVVMLVRIVIGFVRSGSFSLGEERSLRYVIIADEQEAERVAGLIRQTELRPAFIGLVSVGPKPEKESFVGEVSQIEEIIRIYAIDEVIFCAKSLTQTRINNLMTLLSRYNVRFTIAPPTADFVIGSNTINSPSDLYVINVNSVSSEDNRRKKRLFDLGLCLFLSLFYFFVFWFQHRPLGLLKNIVLVLLNRKTWVGYCNEGQVGSLASLKPSVLNPGDALPAERLEQATLHKLNLLYARNYSLANDYNIIIKGFRHLGR